MIYLVHRSEVVANLAEPLKLLFGLLHKDGFAPFLAGSIRQQLTASRPQRRLTPEQLQDLVSNYEAGKGSIYSLVKVYGISHHTVSAHLRATGLMLSHQPLSNGEIEKARQLRRAGLSFNTIGGALGRDPKTVKRVLK